MRLYCLNTDAVTHGVCLFDTSFAMTSTPLCLAIPIFELALPISIPTTLDMIRRRFDFKVEF